MFYILLMLRTLLSRFAPAASVQCRRQLHASASRLQDGAAAATEPTAAAAAAGTATAAASSAPPKSKKKAAAQRQVDKEAVACLKISNNNCIVTVTNGNGEGRGGMIGGKNR